MIQKIHTCSNSDDKNREVVPEKDREDTDLSDSNDNKNPEVVPDPNKDQDT